MFAFFFLALTRAEVQYEATLESIELPQLTPADYKELAEAVVTVLFKNGKCLNVINGISDAITHSRSGCGVDLPAGPKLYEEMARFQKYKENFDPETGKFFEDLKNQAKKLIATADKGVIKEYGQGYVCWCITMGGYVVYPAYSLNVEVVNTQEGRMCHVYGVSNMSGQDYWDFDDVPSYGWLKNLVEEKIPEWLVKLRTKNMQPFYTKYNFDLPVDFTFKVD
ncbi:hypothetical protein TVAG_065710 [Trichomonas vaginalis G3]|uniref:Uncharacterized protein n=1 Tax=Trichomonas vaginalis (strain ATCC PRA-98 / G3) TaxID=412133 RepID=A2ELX5_TRIV3|nr:hypothetical protein TVAGG3_0988570 [Trichomonas vaginalis G3]EAY06314.1 hypothetical protein TVAG_065710 [Trichomonas vaginalis G3]KAI5489850.1 hypothetical protein TVAGG3_0988570 [Trichomonas vaginalis G3]|eukprot:XP_001318537.1 hypothetical protein [Trichomonas vaginalis G3]